VRLRFEWDEEKNRRNLRKHKISFLTATGYLKTRTILMEQDREVDGEARWQTIGPVGDVMVLMVAHTVLDEDEDVVFRIISARKATVHERRRYEAYTD
jgi:uncharacterized protein